MPSAKEAARQVIERLPAQATWWRRTASSTMHVAPRGSSWKTGLGGTTWRRDDP